MVVSHKAKEDAASTDAPTGLETSILHEAAFGNLKIS